MKQIPDDIIIKVNIDSIYKCYENLPGNIEQRIINILLYAECAQCKFLKY